MFRRILRSTIVLVAVIAAYQAYVLLAVPHMEPPLAVREQRPSKDPNYKGNESISQYQRLLSNYFPKDHWSQLQKPKVFANGTGQMMLVIDDYTRLPVAKYRMAWAAPQSGVVTSIDAERVGRAAVALGAGRDRADAAVNHGVGIDVVAPIGTTVGKGDPILTVAYDNETTLAAAQAVLANAITIDSKTSPVGPTVLEIVRG